jgi:membrane protease YdiL (CAAX protease family)
LKERSAIIRELALVILIGVVPMILIGATLFKPSAEEPPPPYPIEVSSQVRGTLMLTTYILFFLAPAIAIARSGQSLEHFGIVWRGRDEWTWGIFSFLLNYALGWVIWWVYWATNFPLGVESIAAYHYVHASSIGEMVSTWPYYVLVVIAEEQMARCYLITRFRDLGARPWVAIAISSLLFASWHTFWGAAGVVHIIKAGVVFGWVFVRRESVAAPAIAHFIFDALSLLPR